jgi:hypothetical protein
MASNVFSFIAIIAIIMLGFSISFRFIVANSKVTGYESVNETVYSLFLAMFGTFEAGDFNKIENITGLPAFAKIFQIVFVILSLLVLGNLLVGKLFCFFKNALKLKF